MRDTRCRLQVAGCGVKGKKYDQLEIKYKIIHTRRRSICITVNPDRGVIVRAPYHTPVETIERFISEKEAWIRKHLNKYSGIIRLNKKEYNDGDYLSCQGKMYRLRVINSSQLYVNQHDDIIEAGTDGRDGTINALIDLWYRKRAEVLIHGRFREILTRYGSYEFKPSGLAVRPLKSRWGSCTSRGKITINSELIKLDEHFVDYVIIHELCHLRYHNHGKDYQRLLEELVPDYREFKKELRKYSLS